MYHRHSVTIQKDEIICMLESWQLLSFFFNSNPNSLPKTVALDEKLLQTIVNNHSFMQKKVALDLFTNNGSDCYCYHLTPWRHKLVT